MSNAPKLGISVAETRNANPITRLSSPAQLRGELRATSRGQSAWCRCDR